MSAPLRGRSRRLLQQQLPPGAPPDFVPPARPQPLPVVNRLAQVFSTYGVLPVAGRMFAQSMTVDGSTQPEGTVWTYDLTTPAGWVRILRGVRVLPRRTVANGGRMHYRLAGPGDLSMRLRLNRMPPPDINDVDGASSVPLAVMGETWPVYLMAVGGDLIGLRMVSAVSWPPGYRDLTVIFYGDMLKARSLPRELEVGHEAAMVKVIQGAGEEHME